MDPDGTSHSVVSHLGLHCLLRPNCPNTYAQLHFLYRCWDIEVVLAPDPVGLVYRYTSQSLH